MDVRTICQAQQLEMLSYRRGLRHGFAVGLAGMVLTWALTMAVVVAFKLMG
jgi:hypothetical protein